MTPSVLVVEDNVDVAAALAGLLEANGFTAHRLHDGESACEWLQDHDVDLIVTDFRMEPVNGIEFLRQARRHCDAPAILYTAYPDLGVAALRMARVSHVLRKPGDPQQLVQAAKTLAANSVAWRQRDAALRHAVSPRPPARHLD